MYSEEWAQISRTLIYFGWGILDAEIVLQLQLTRKKTIKRVDVLLELLDIPGSLSIPDIRIKKRFVAGSV